MNGGTPFAVAETIKRQIPFSRNRNGIDLIHQTVNKLNSSCKRKEDGDVTYDGLMMIEPVSNTIRYEVSSKDGTPGVDSEGIY